MRGYKVTDCDGYSVGRKLRKNPPDAGIIHYPVGRFIKPLPGMGPLAVFQKQKDALRFRDHFNGNFLLSPYLGKAIKLKLEENNI